MLTFRVLSLKGVNFRDNLLKSSPTISRSLRAERLRFKVRVIVRVRVRVRVRSNQVLLSPGGEAPPA